MRILLIAEYFRPGIGGLENSTLYLAGALGARHDVEVYTPVPPGPLGDDMPLSVRRFPARDRSPYAAMWAHLSAGTPPGGVCFFGFSHRWTDDQLAFLCRVRRETPARVCVKLPTLREFRQYIGTPARLGDLLAADALICPNPDIRARVVAAGVPRSKAVHRPNGVPLHRFTPPAPDAGRAARAALGLDADRLLFLFSGRFAARKGVGLLVEAFRRVPDVDLALVGYFDDRFDEGGAFDAGDAGNIHLFEPVRDVLPWLRAADIIVSASREEGMPNAILEGLASGIPALVSDIPGHREVVENGRTGWLFAPESVADLVDRITWFRDNPSSLPSMGAAARRAAAARFDIRSVADTYARLLAEGAGS